MNKKERILALGILIDAVNEAHSVLSRFPRKYLTCQCYCKNEEMFICDEK